MLQLNQFCHPLHIELVENKRERGERKRRRGERKRERERKREKGEREEVVVM